LATDLTVCTSAGYRLAIKLKVKTMESTP